MKNIIVIPVYKKELSKWEEISLRQCVKVLSAHPICLVTHGDLDCSFYNQIAEEYGLALLREDFDVHYFKDLDSYNKLMISKDFYERFKHYQYMLIYQLDAFVFRDELDEWCAKGYDYIGAPWFEEYSSYEQGAQLWKVGNGGFSLRNIQTSIKILTYFGPIWGLKYLWNSVANRDILHRCYFVFKSLLGWHNTIDYYVSEYVNQEDLFWCFEVQKLGFNYRMPSAEEAIAFSIERSPKYLYHLNNDILPFGCHAWYKYDYESFWKQFIK